MLTALHFHEVQHEISPNLKCGVGAKRLVSSIWDRLEHNCLKCGKTFLAAAG